MDQANPQPEQERNALGQDRIDQYLDLVERTLMMANAPRSDRMQVIQDLESQISEMLTASSEPRSDALVIEILQRMEPASHFAAMYGQAEATAQPKINRPKPRGPHLSRWILAAAALVGFLILTLLTTPLILENDELALMTIFMVIPATLIATPFVWWMGVREIRANPGVVMGRDIALWSFVIFKVLAMAILLLAITLLTEGLILIPIGFLAFLWFTYRWIRWSQSKLMGDLPIEQRTLVASVPIGALSPA